MQTNYEILKKYNIKTPKMKFIKYNEEINFDTFPCVLKIDSNTHKSDIGGVIIDIRNNLELKEAKEKILKKFPKTNLIIQQQIKGIEFYIGGICDNIFEEVILFGMGGVMLEINKDITYIDKKATKKEIKKAIKTLKSYKLFEGFRNQKVDINKTIDLIKNFQKLMKEDISEIDINPIMWDGEDFYAVDLRIKTGKKRKKHANKTFSLFENKNVAIIGASENPNKVGFAIAKNALSSKANIYFVNPKIKTLFNQKVYKLKELKNIDTAVLSIPTQAVLSTIKELILKGCKNFVIISAGFKESGNIKDEVEIKKLAKKYKLNIVGPNCLGIYNSKLDLNLTFAKSKIYKGNIGLISQSGAVLTALMDKASARKIGFSHIISMGNMADFNFAHAINELNNQKECKIIAIYIEGIQYGKAFLKAIRKSKKPILIFKSGKSDEAKKAAFSHTGNLSGNYEMIINLSKLAGAKIVNSIESLIWHKNIKEAIIVTNAGGPGTILTDLLVKNGIKLKDIKPYKEKLDKILPPTWSKNNPIDIIGDATAKRYKDTLEVLKDENIFVIVTPQFMTNEVEIANILKKYKNVIPIFLENADEVRNIIDVFDSLEEASKIC